ncbi:ASKHA domain-containing protein [Geosporobacter ferrireducens]|uniref:ASKHA domain-containing protein n=1 Tax=Geosporobacter ferrireducens TaxID=1424294 RepID=UPI0009F2884D|nr:ASKHA domain-containing protein [Geosporobacter ferrireducens]
MRTINKFSWVMQRDRVLRAMDCREKGSTYDILCSSYTKLEDVLKEIVKPEGGYCFQEKKAFPEVKAVSKYTHVAYCFLTLGEAISEEISRYFHQGDYLEGMLLDVMADELIFNFSNQLYSQVCDEAESLGLGLTGRIEPGEKDASLSVQKDILSLFQEKGAALDLLITEAYMLKPVKSMTFLYGASAELPLRKADHSCIDCSKTACKFREAEKLYIQIVQDENEYSIEIDKGENLLRGMQRHDIFVKAPCGGTGVCGKCKVQIKEGNIPAAAEDQLYFSQDELEKGYRLACQAYPTENCSVFIEAANEDQFRIVSDYSGKPMEKNSWIQSFRIAIVPSDFQKNKSLVTLFNEKLGGDYTYSKRSLMKLVHLMDQKQSIPNTVRDGHKTVIECILEEQCIIDIFIDEEATAYGIAIDIGTTTIAMQMIELISGEVLGNHSLLNRQRGYGEDVISRIQYSNEGNLDKLSKCIQEDILKGIYDLCQTTSVNLERIVKIAIVGNTTMLHLLLGLSCTSLAVHPFQSITTALHEFHFSEIFGQLSLECKVIILPGVSTYVGADIIAGMLYCGFHEEKETTLLIDIGTNGEMAIGNKDKILSLSTAAGPALEGGNIQYGTGSIRGAISRVEIDKDKLSYRTIGDLPPIGICGSGVIDIVASCCKNGIIDETGRFSECYEDGVVEVARTVEDQAIVFTQKDVREVQLAKSALRSGIEILMQRMEIVPEEIERVYIAGGFGGGVNIDSAITIGLIPKELKDKIVSVGNSALGGAAAYLINRKNRDRIEEILKKTSYIELSTDMHFQDLFVNNMFFYGVGNGEST